jgi:hypothetical protein
VTLQTVMDNTTVVVPVVVRRRRKLAADENFDQVPDFRAETVPKLG